MEKKNKKNNKKIWKIKIKKIKKKLKKLIKIKINYSLLHNPSSSPSSLFLFFFVFFIFFLLFSFRFFYFIYFIFIFISNFFFFLIPSSYLPHLLSDTRRHLVISTLSRLSSFLSLGFSVFKNLSSFLRAFHQFRKINHLHFDSSLFNSLSCIAALLFYLRLLFSPVIYFFNVSPRPWLAFSILLSSRTGKFFLFAPARAKLISSR